MDVIGTWLEDISTWSDIFGAYDKLSGEGEDSVNIKEIFESSSELVKNTGKGGFAEVFKTFSSAMEGIFKPTVETK